MPVKIGTSTPNDYQCDAPGCRSAETARYLPAGWLRFKIETIRRIGSGRDVPEHGAVACGPPCVPGALAVAGEALGKAAGAGASA